MSLFKPLLILLLLASGISLAAETPEPLEELAAQDELRLVVTDSGLGGLSVAAEIASRARKTGAYQSVDIVFANALFRPEAGYNSLESRDEKVAIFDAALHAMADRYEPDAILVACNTLSVLLPDCSAAQSGDVPIAGIVDIGVDLIEKELTANPDAVALLFATPTTVDEGSHRQGLIERGVSPDRIVLQPCADLTWNIEQDPTGFDTELLISFFVDEALGKLPERDTPVAMSFNCTHFGYSRALWETEMKNQGGQLAATIDPNLRMADPLFPDSLTGRFEDPTVTVSTVSMVPIPETAVAAIASALEETSPETAASLRAWDLSPGLFDWQAAVALLEAPAEPAVP